MARAGRYFGAGQVALYAFFAAGFSVLYCWPRRASMANALTSSAGPSFVTLQYDDAAETFVATH